MVKAISARREISIFREKIPQDSSLGPSESSELAKQCHEAMELGIETGRGLVAPGFLSLLFITARSGYWDAWTLDLSWYILIMLPIVICLAAAIIVRAIAISYRNKLIDALKEARFLKQTNRRSNSSVKHLDLAIEEVERLRRGPYGPISRDYLLGAVVIAIAVLASSPLSTIFNRWVL